MSELDKTIIKLRQKLQLDTRIGYLGNGTGEVHDRRYPGRYYVRFAQADGGYTAPVSISANPNANLPATDGLPVDIGYDASGQMIIIRANVPGMTESGYNLLQLNPLDNQAEKLINQTQITTFYTTRHSDLTNKPFYAVVFPGFLYINTTVTYFAGSEINLASLQPSAGDHCFAVVFIKGDATLEAFASTAINTSDPLTTVDIQEAINAATVGSQPLWVFEITGDDTALTVDPSHQADLRAFVGGGVLGSGGGTVTSVALTAAPTGVFDVSGSPITGAGTLALSMDNQAANTVLAGPTSGGAATPGFRTFGHSELTGLTTGDDHTQYLLRQPSANWTIDASALRMGAIGGAAVAAQKLTVYTGADTNIGLLIKANSATQSANLLELDSSAGSPLLTVSATGQFMGLSKTYTDPTVTNILINATYTLQPTATALSAFQRLLYFTANLNGSGGGASEFSAVHVDIYNNQTSGTTNQIYAYRAIPRISNAGLTSAIRSYWTQLITTAAGSGNVDNFAGFFVASPSLSGTAVITTMYGLRVSNLGVSSLVTNTYGLYIDNQQNATTINSAITTNAGNVVFNEGGNADTDFRVEGDTDANLLFTDASADSVGIGTASPTAFLHLKAATTAAASLRIPVGTAPTSPNAGDIWHDTTQKTLQAYLAGINQAMQGVIFTQTADKTVNNTVTETTLIGTGIGTMTLPANFWTIGKTIHIRAKGYFSTTGNPNIQFKGKYGSTVLSDSGAFAAGAGITNHLYTIDLVITCRTTGSSGTVYTQGWGLLFTGHTTLTEFDMESTATVTINTTTSNALDLTVTWGTADAANTITTTNLTVEVLN